MIIMLENGRLGNQLFKYCAVKSAFPSETITLIGFDDLDDLLEDLGDRVIRRNRHQTAVKAISRFHRFFNSVFRMLPIISVIRETISGDTVWIKKNTGALSLLSYVPTDVFFEAASLITDASLEQFVIKKQLIQKAKTFLSTLPGSGPRIFLHIRRGDFVREGPAGVPAILPIQWYRNAQQIIRSKYDNPIFVIATDDHRYASDTFGADLNTHISCNDHLIDFTILTLCDAGILSPSTFAWWGARFGQANACKQQYYIAPKFWAGHRLGTWAPRFIKTENFEYLPVPAVLDS